MKKTIDLIISVTLMVAIALMIAILPTEEDAAIYEDTVRLHILANSNSDADQSLKYEIRDLLLQKYGRYLGDTKSPEDAKERITALESEIQGDVELWISERGYDYGCEVKLCEEWYDTREYEDFTLPKGIYTSLKVMIGDAEGKNWWCVMYPPMCLDIATEDAPSDDAVIGYTEEEYALITDSGYNVKFKILEVFSEAFSKNS